MPISILGAPRLLSRSTRLPEARPEQPRPSRGEDWARFSGTASPRRAPSAERTTEAPRTVEDPWQELHLADGAISLVFDASLKRAVAHVAIPLSSLDPSPMSRDDFAAAISRVTVPAPWGAANATFEVAGGELRIAAGALEPAAWSKVAPKLMVELASGQSVLISASVAKVAADTGAFDARQREAQRDNLSKIITSAERRLADLRGIAADPSRVEPSTIRDQLAAERDELHGRIRTLRGEIASRWATATGLDRVLVHGIAADARGVPAEAAALHKEEVSANNQAAAMRARAAELTRIRDAAASAGAAPLAARTDAEIAALEAPIAAAEAKRDAAGEAIDALFHAHGLDDALIDAAHVPLFGNQPQGASFGELVRRAAGRERLVQEATRQLEDNRARAAASAAAAIPAAEAELTSRRAQLAALAASTPEPSVRWLPGPG